MILRLRRCCTAHYLLLPDAAAMNQAAMRIGNFRASVLCGFKPYNQAVTPFVDI